MGIDAAVAIATVLGVFALLAVGRYPAYLVVLAGATVLVVTGVLEPAAALEGFGNPAVVTVGVLFVVAAGLRQTGALAYLVRRALGRPRTVPQAQARLALPVLMGSAFVNNTPVVAMLLPVVQDWCRASRMPLSKVLLPLSYLAILGGMTTVVGTSTNLVVNGLFVKSGHESLGIFGITALGLPCAVLGVGFLLLFANRLLPLREVSLPPAETPREYAVEMSVAERARLVGRPIEASGLAHMPGLRLSQVQRGQEVFPAPGPSLLLAAGDLLVFIGVVDSILDLLRVPGLELGARAARKLASHPVERCYVEAVVSRTSPLVGRTVREVRFLELYEAAVLGISRNGQRLRSPLRDVEFRPGDALLLEARRSFVDEHRNSGEFSLISRIVGEGPATSAQAPLALGILVSMAAVVSLGWLTMLEAALVAAGAMLLTRCCSEDTARQAIDWPLLLTIGGSFALGRALQDTGVAAAVAHSLLAIADGHPWASLIIVYGTTALLSELVTNNAAAVIVFPIALATSAELGANPLPFVVAVMLAASSSFATPIGYQTNLMVYGPGGYRFSDFLRLGIPMKLLLWALTALLAPLIWPF